MANDTRARFLARLAEHYGPVRKLENSQSLYEVCGGAAHVYLRYSKLHPRRQAFYGLRDVDLRAVQGGNALVCFLWDGQDEPLVLPLAEYEELFFASPVASDGQYKVQVQAAEAATELYIARVGRFNVESEGCDSRKGHQQAIA